jgi:hypothetical protein
MVTSMIGAKNLITMGVFGIILNLLYLDAFSHHLLNLNPSCYFNEGNLVQQGVEPHKHLRVQSDEGRGEGRRNYLLLRGLRLPLL